MNTDLQNKAKILSILMIITGIFMILNLFSSSFGIALAVLGIILIVYAGINLSKKYINHITATIVFSGITIGCSAIMSIYLIFGLIGTISSSQFYSSVFQDIYSSIIITEAVFIAINIITLLLSIILLLKALSFKKESDKLLINNQLNFNEAKSDD